MCGITGHIAGKGRGSEDAVHRMNDALAHRGPDAEGIWSSGRAVLGHRRLSIVDLSVAGNQPLLNETGDIGVVVNGEIYNFEAIREELRAKGHAFQSDSDSEIVVHGYEEWGDAIIAKLTGMYAIALWDSRRERLLLARDRAGKKPLLYRPLPDGGVVFASEVQAVAKAFPDAPLTPDLGAIDEYLTLQYVPTPRTVYKEIFKLPAASVAVFEKDRAPRVEPYWAKPTGPTLEGDEEELSRELLRLLEKSVKRRLMSDVPLGAFLSGGIDSSAIVALMARGSSRPVKTFSIGFPDEGDSELKWARLVAERYSTEHHEEVVTPDIADLVKASVHHHGEPFADSSSIAMFCLARMTKKYVTVALSGDGSDETFAGYTRYKTARLAHFHDVLPRPAQAAFRAAAGAVAGIAAPHVAGFVDHLGDGEAVRYPYIMCQFTPEEKELLYLPDMRAVMNGATERRFEGRLDESAHRSPIGRLIDLDWWTYMVDDINVKVDIAAMAYALEVRCPFLDTDVVEFAARLPGKMLMRFQGKRLLRRAIKDIVPKPILRRRKRGFGLPLRRWMKQDLAPMVKDVLLDKTARERGLFEPREVERILLNLDSDRNAPDRAWTLLMLELWFREFVDAR
jgi:asparagine synthase (glutamine-hydrolysing)